MSPPEPRPGPPAPLPDRTRTAAVERTPDGVVVLRIDADAVQSVDDAKENVATAVRVGGARCPLLVDMRSARPLPPETRHYYSGKVLTDCCSALGLLVNVGAFGRMTANVYLRIARPGIPARLFVDESDALAWLREHRK